MVVAAALPCCVDDGPDVRKGQRARFPVAHDICALGAMSCVAFFSAFEAANAPRCDGTVCGGLIAGGVASLAGWKVLGLARLEWMAVSMLLLALVGLSRARVLPREKEEL